MATTKKIKNMSLAEVEKAIAETEARTRILNEIREKKRKEEYAELCRMIAEFVLDLSDLTAQPVVHFRKRMEEKKYEAAAKILTTAAENAPARAARKDQEITRKKGKQSTEMMEGMGA